MLVKYVHDIYGHMMVDGWSLGTEPRRMPANALVLALFQDDCCLRDPRGWSMPLVLAAASPPLTTHLNSSKIAPHLALRLYWLHLVTQEWSQEACKLIQVEMAVDCFGCCSGLHSSVQRCVLCGDLTLFGRKFSRCLKTMITLEFSESRFYDLSKREQESADLRAAKSTKLVTLNPVPSELHCCWSWHKSSQSGDSLCYGSSQGDTDTKSSSNNQAGIKGSGLHSQQAL